MKTTPKSKPIPLHRKLRKETPKQKLGQNIDQQILVTIAGNFNEKTVRTKFIQMGLAQKGAVGCCFVTRDIEDQWLSLIHI